MNPPLPPPPARISIRTSFLKLNDFLHLPLIVKMLSDSKGFIGLVICNTWGKRGVN
uniref:Uncharacterized protein n=1 Tax=Octopus bimaculoides TaxID=37653 RepID=A0A0L8FXU9_OCTBM